jgi:hypothetical protein
MVSINRKLNLVVPILRGDKTELYIHSVPIMPETFKVYHLVMAKTFSTLAQNNLDPRSGPSVAAMIMEEVAKSTWRLPGMNWWEGPDGVGGEAGLMAEIIRLSNVIRPTKEAGWQSIPLQSAINQNLIDEEERMEVINLLCFFTVVSLMAPRADREKLVKGLAAIYELQATYSTSTDWINSLTTSTVEETTGAEETV